MTTITFIGYGEAGGILADALAKENPVTVWDCKFNGPERDAMIMKARQGGVQAAISLADALTGAELIFSTVTAGSALDVASQAAPLMADKQYSPQTKRQAAERFKPGTYVDVAVMAPVPPAALRTPLLIGGPQGEAIAELLTALGCHARYGGNDIGSVSAIKMCRSVMIKGLEALTVECLFAAHRYGVEEAVLASLHASFPSLGWNDAFPGYLISRVAEHGFRRSEEMEEVVKTLRDAAGDSVMSQATAIAQRHLPERMAALGITYAQLEPFNWKALTALLKDNI
ncbi:DUF1932 domain-containing protein [Kluyvera georgiana]|uniref:DUF1932 domain-containing protein n=1 Tax=Kluyvera georgiana TaxID=73098 RepID=UPI003F678428